MKDIMHRNTGLISALAAFILILVIYTMLGTVDVVFMQGEVELHRMEDVSAISSLELSDEDIEGVQDMSFTYTSGETTKTFGDNFEFRFEIAKTVLLNFITFKWQPGDQVIVLNAN